MTRFPVLEGKEVVAGLKKYGFSEERRRGSDIFMKHADGRAQWFRCMLVKPSVRAFSPKSCEM
jgi:predicted RNA binding protein YcfA (HicA-like mRNA interferase family)